MDDDGWDDLDAASVDMLAEIERKAFINEPQVCCDPSSIQSFHVPICGQLRLYCSATAHHLVLFFRLPRLAWKQASTQPKARPVRRSRKHSTECMCIRKFCYSAISRPSLQTSLPFLRRFGVFQSRQFPEIGKRFQVPAKENSRPLQGASTDALTPSFQRPQATAAPSAPTSEAPYRAQAPTAGPQASSDPVPSSNYVRFLALLTLPMFSCSAKVPM